MKTMYISDRKKAESPYFSHNFHVVYNKLALSIAIE